MTTKCAPNKARAGQAARPAASHTNHPDTAIAQKSTDQTTGNAQFGGVHFGLRRLAYQAPGRNTAPVDAAAKLATKKIASALIEDDIMAVTNLLRGAAAHETT